MAPSAMGRATHAAVACRAYPGRILRKSPLERHHRSVAHRATPYTTWAPTVTAMNSAERRYPKTSAYGVSHITPSSTRPHATAVHHRGRSTNAAYINPKPTPLD